MPAFLWERADLSFRKFWFVLLCLTGPVCAQLPPEAEVIRLRDASEMRRDANLKGYSVTEQYSVRSSRFNISAEMTVAVVFRKDHGKTRRVISRTGSGMLQSRVFDRLLREEDEMGRGEARLQSLVTSMNYGMKLSGQEMCSGVKCYVLELNPRRSSTHLLKGRAWVDAEDGSLIRLEGRPGASPSFLTGRPFIVREFEKVGEFRLAKSSNAVSDSFLFGRTELHIDYRDYKLEDESTP